MAYDRFHQVGGYDNFTIQKDNDGTYSIYSKRNITDQSPTLVDRGFQTSADAQLSMLRLRNFEPQDTHQIRDAQMRLQPQSSASSWGFSRPTLAPTSSPSPSFNGGDGGSLSPIALGIIGIFAVLYLIAKASAGVYHLYEVYLMPWDIWILKLVGITHS